MGSAVTLNEHSTGGAPPDNENRVRHGVFSWCAAGRVPLKIKGGAHLRAMLRVLRRGLVLETENVHGRAPSIFEQGVIASAVRHEGRARLLEMVVQREWETLAAAERVAILREIGSASDSRDKCLRSIGLDKRPEPLPASLAALLGSLPPLDSPEPANRPESRPSNSDAPAGPLGEAMAVHDLEDK